MRFFRESCRFLCLPLVVLMLLASAPLSSVHAALISTDQVIAGPAAGLADHDKIVSFLQQQPVRDQILAMGVEPAEVEARLATLSPAELSQLSDRIDQMPAGQSTAGVIVGGIVIVFLVLLLTDLLGLTDIFPFVDKQN